MEIVDANAIIGIAIQQSNLEVVEQAVWREAVESGFVNDSVYGFTCFTDSVLYLCGGRSAFMLTALRLALLALPEAVFMDWYPYMRHPDTDSSGDKCVNLFRDVLLECGHKKVPATSYYWEVLQYHGEYPNFIDEGQGHPVVSAEWQHAGIWQELWVSEQKAYEVLTEHKCPWVMQVVPLSGDFAWLIVTSRSALWLGMKCLQFAQEIETCGTVVNPLRNDLVLLKFDRHQCDMVHRSANETHCLSALVKQLTQFRGQRPI